MPVKQSRFYILAAFTAVCIIPLLFIDAIPQNPSYHCFADQATILGIPNFWNVFSNLPFLIVAIWGFRKFRQQSEIRNLPAAFVFFAGVFLTGIGSSYYHWSPDNNTLVWDRLPMTLVFLSLLSFVITFCIDQKTGKNLLYTLIIFGIGSVWYWSLYNDLRIYVLAQFYPLLAIPLIVFLFPSVHIQRSYLLWAAFIYLIAKVFEYTDTEVYVATTILSGHTLKHLFSALAIIPLTTCIVKAKKINIPF